MTFSASNIPLSLYVHIPWCVRKCPYCDFNSHQTDGRSDAMGYVEALLSDLSYEAELVGDRKVTSIFIGGGTPSLFPPEAIEDLLRGVGERISLSPDAEITMEANPGAFEADWYAGYCTAGVNRLSIGVQSFDDRSLQALGRIHDADQAGRAIEQALSSGFGSVNIDLMFGLPGQRLKQAERDLSQAIAFRPEHISYYQLTLEPNTLFHTQRPVLPEEDLIAQIHEEGQARLADGGYLPYEVSAYAGQVNRCLHNINYWEFGDYLGIGAGAHGKITLDSGVRRRWRVRHPEAFERGAGSASAVSGQRELGERDLILEFMMNALRLRQGFTGELFESRTGLAMDSVQGLIESCEARGLMIRQGERYRASANGRRYLNELLEVFCV